MSIIQSILFSVAYLNFLTTSVTVLSIRESLICLLQSIAVTVEMQCNKIIFTCKLKILCFALCQTLQTIIKIK